MCLGMDPKNNIHLYNAAVSVPKNDSIISTGDQSFNNPDVIESSTITEDVVKIKSENYNKDNGVGKNIEFVEIKEPSLNEMKDNFKKEFNGTNNTYLEPNNPLLISKLNKIGQALDADPKSTEKLISYAIDLAVNVAHPDNEDLEETYAENRTRDMLSVFDKVKQNKPLTTDDIQNLQLFIFMDTEHGRMLHDKEGEDGIDGKFGPRTNSAFDLFLKEQNIQ
jgi:hypothetical protein